MKHVYRSKIKPFLVALKEALKTFWVDDYTYQASALSFITLLSIVPFLSIITFIINLSGKYLWVLSETTEFIYDNFLPSTGNILEKYLQQFAESASQLPLMSIIFFVVTVFLLINTLESTLNHIWNVKAYRSLSNKLVSWSALLFFPFIIGITTIANDLINLIFHNHTFSQIFLKLTVFTTHVVLFAMLYTLVPNTRLKFKNALYGGVLVGILFHLLKFFFVIYIIYFTNFTAIYGSMAVIPVFLTWLYFSWCVFLFGAIYIHRRSQITSST